MIDGIIDCCIELHCMMSVKKKFVAVGRLKVKRLNWSIKYMFGSCAGEC
jgi:hypothetical protein